MIAPPPPSTFPIAPVRRPIAGAPSYFFFFSFPPFQIRIQIYPPFSPPPAALEMAAGSPSPSAAAASSPLVSNGGAATPGHRPDTDSRGRRVNKPKCSKCGNVARSRLVSPSRSLLSFARTLGFVGGFVFVGRIVLNVGIA